ncbi:hypothetical protein FBU30_000425 [Linnemannia zychae]|nr:hypothetical protein FBU30_000425 [Linnemannia zychae]
MSPIISKNKFSLLSNGNTNSPETMTNPSATSHSVTVYPYSNDSQESNNYSHNLTNDEQTDNDSDDGEWIVKTTVKRQSRRNNIDNSMSLTDDNKNWKYSIEESEDEDDGYMSFTEHELSKHSKATQLKNIRTHPGVPLHQRRHIK